MDNNNFIKLAGIAFTNSEVEELRTKFINDEKFIIKYKSIYQIFINSDNTLYTQLIYTLPKNEKLGYTLKGRFIIADPNFTNILAGFKLVNI